MKRDFLRCLAGATAASVLLTGTSTFAADLGVAPPLAPLPVFTWTGFELGVQVGGGAGRTTVHVDGDGAPFPKFPSSDAYGSSGVFGGIHVGFNYQFAGPIVAGVQLEYNFAGITGTASAPPLNYLETSIRQFGSADGRIGDHYDKIKLLAFGEYIPLGDYFPALYRWSPMSSHLQRGTTTAPLRVAGYRFATVICYEDILPDIVRTVMADHGEGRAHALVNLTNDSWYGRGHEQEQRADLEQRHRHEMQQQVDAVPVLGRIVAPLPRVQVRSDHGHPPR